MRIGIDGRCFRSSSYNGVPATVFQVIRSLTENHPEHEYFIISCLDIHINCELPDNWHLVVRPAKSGNGTLWLLFSLSGIIRELKLDAFWGTHYFLPSRVRGCRLMVSVHDMAYLRYPETIGRRNLIALRLLCRPACRRADVIHSVSEATAADITEFFGIPRSNISVVYWGSPEKTAEAAQYGDLAPKSFFLFLSTLEPRKNPVAILDAFRRFKEDGGEGSLVFAGSKGWLTESFDAAYEAFPYKDDVILAGFVSEEEKVWLLRNAAALLYPSLYEGFGIPILEAMQEGTPVITSRISSMPEVGGDAALYVDDPSDSKGIAALMKQAVSMTADELEAVRLREKANLERFSWKRCADELLELLVSGKR